MIRPPPGTGTCPCRKDQANRPTSTIFGRDRLTSKAIQRLSAPSTSPALAPCSSCRCSKKATLIGTISIYRQEVRPFTDKQIELVKNFAAQAVIAIENTRLLNELRENLQQQTATADVLNVIASSPGELEAVFQAMLKYAVRICGAKFGNLWLREGDNFRSGATYGAPRAFQDYLRREPRCIPIRDWALAA